MNSIRTFLGAAALVASSFTPALADKIALSEISRYLNGLQTAKGEFTQINDDGTISTGQIFIKRPGRMRFEYNPPSPSLVIAGGGTVAVFDAKSNQPPEQFPLGKTPLSIILAKNVDLSRARMVVGHKTDGNTTTVVAQDPEHPDYGSISMVFTANPTELRQWVVKDGSGATTTVVLGELAKGGAIANKLFDITAATASVRN